MMSETEIKNGDVAYWVECDSLNTVVVLNYGKDDTRIETTHFRSVPQVIPTKWLHLCKEDAQKEIDVYKKEQEKQAQEKARKYRYKPFIKWVIYNPLDGLHVSSSARDMPNRVNLYVNEFHISNHALNRGAFYERRLAELKRKMLAELEQDND